MQPCGLPAFSFRPRLTATLYDEVDTGESCGLPPSSFQPRVTANLSDELPQAQPVASLHPPFRPG